jgi:hypothetical protein
MYKWKIFMSSYSDVSLYVFLIKKYMKMYYNNRFVCHAVASLKEIDKNSNILFDIICFVLDLLYLLNLFFRCGTGSGERKKNFFYVQPAHTFFPYSISNLMKIRRRKNKEALIKNIELST